MHDPLDSITDDSDNLARLSKEEIMALAPQPTPRPAPTSAPRPAVAPAPKPSKLAGITVGAQPNPRSFFLYGVRKFGKSTTAADAPAPIFIDPTHATEHLHVARYPDPASGIWTWQDVLDAIDDLLASQHEFKTFVIEDVGDLEQIIWRHMFDAVPISDKEGRASNIESYGYGKGYKIANQFWRLLTARLDELRMKRKMNVILLGHSSIQTQKNPSGLDYDTYQPAIYKEAAGILGANCDVIGFCTFDDAAVTKNRKTIGATGTRVIRLGHDAAWPMTGSRLPLPDIVDIGEEHPFQPFAAAMAQLEGMSPEMLRQKISAELDRVGSPFLKSDGTESTRDKVVTATKAAGDNLDTLTRFLTLLRQANPLTSQTETTP